MNPPTPEEIESHRRVMTQRDSVLGRKYRNYSDSEVIIDVTKVVDGSSQLGMMRVLDLLLSAYKGEGVK